MLMLNILVRTLCKIQLIYVCACKILRETISQYHKNVKLIVEAHK